MEIIYLYTEPNHLVPTLQHRVSATLDILYVYSITEMWVKQYDYHNYIGTHRVTVEQ